MTPLPSLRLLPTEALHIAHCAQLLFTARKIKIPTIKILFHITKRNKVKSINKPVRLL